MRYLCLVFMLAMSTLALGQTQDQCPSCTVMGGHLVAGGNVTLGNFGGNSITPGWQVLQVVNTGASNYPTPCGNTASSCTFSTLVPTTAGSVWVVNLYAGNSVSLTTAGGWTLASGCQLFYSASVGDLDCAYKIGGAAGTTSITVGITPAATGYFQPTFTEIMPPSCNGSPCTVTFDAAGNNGGTSSCSTSCPGVALTLSATDVVLQFVGYSSTLLVGNAPMFSSPYLTSSSGGTGIGLNITSGSAPTWQQSSAGNAAANAIAFKSSAGIFIAGPPVIYTLASAPSNGFIPCTSTCSPNLISGNDTTISTGDLLFYQYACPTANSVISSVSNTNGTWNVSTSCQKYNASAGAISCAYAVANSTTTSN